MIIIIFGSRNMFGLIPISTYFLLNLLVTISNKSIVSQTSSPFCLTAFHAATSYLAIGILIRYNANTGSLRPVLTYYQRLTLISFSFLYTINIAISNLSLNLVSMPLHQTIRATAPPLTIILLIVLRHRAPSTYSTSTYLSLIPITLGVAVASYGGSYEASLLGLVLTFAGAVLAVIKTITTHSLQTSMRIKGVDLMHTLAPWAALQSLIFAWHTGEPTLPHLHTIASCWRLGLLLACNGLLAAGLNISSFEANRHCGPVSMAVAANLKQVVILAIELGHSDTVTGRGQVVWGTLMTVAGGIYYALAQREHEKALGREQKPGKNGVSCDGQIEKENDAREGWSRSV